MQYTELKEAAEKYQVLQVGFTLMNRDGQHGAYVAKTFNMYLNPLIKEHLEIERIFAFQSTALDFLLSHKFRLEAAFHEGVPYLSREEERSTVEAEIARADKTTISDIHLKLGDTAALNFVKTTRGQIEQWKNDPVS